MTRDPETGTGDRRPVRRGPLAALAGVAAGAATLGTAELLAALWTRWLGSAGTSSPLLAVGGAFVDRTPPWLKDWAVATFGTADKVALGVGMAITLTVACALLGVLAWRRPALGVGAFAAVGVVGLLAVLSRPATGVVDLVPTALGVVVGIQVLRWLTGMVAGLRAAAPGGPTHPAATRTGGASRRQVLLTAGGVTGVGALGVLAGQLLSTVGRAATRTAQAIGLPTPVSTVSVPDDASSSITGHSDYLTDNADFYRIDTALRVPRVDAQGWTLRVTGMVDEEIEISYDDLLAEDHVEALVTLTCVSNQVGGDLVGNSRWQGWPVRELLARAGVRPEADMVLSRSVDGWTAGTPIEALTDERDSLLAVAMNGEPLPAEHGYPVRLVVPGLYGYVSATKWVTELKVTRFDEDEGYWTPRGWSERGPIKTASRIDVPRSGGELAPDADGSVTLAGVAWAQHRGVDRVELQVDDGDWQEATLLAEPSVDSWRLWTYTWPDAVPGNHQVRVRATDATGETQTEQTASPAPDGASGWHTVDFSVA